MAESERPGGPGSQAGDARASAERRRRLDEVFGTEPVDPSWDDPAANPNSTSREDEWYLENRPPHHG